MSNLFLNKTSTIIFIRMLGHFSKTSFRNIVCFFFMVFICHKNNAQISLFYNEEPASFPNASLSYYLDSSAERTIHRYDIVKSSMKPYMGDVSLNYKNAMVWLHLDLKVIEANKNSIYLMIRNPHINYLKGWLLKNDSVVKEFPLTGDRMVFSSRMINHPDFIFPLPTDSASNYSILFVADKRNELLTLPFHLLTNDGFLSYNRKKSLLTGLIMGLGVFLFFFNLFLFVQMKEWLYVFYGLYVLMGLFYIFSDYGYSFMLLFPNKPMFADYSRPIALSLASPLYLFFCIEFLRLKKELHRSYRWMNTGLIAYLTIFLVSIPLMAQTGIVRVILQNLMQVLLTILVLGNLVVAIIAWRKKIKYAGYVVVTSIFLFVTISLFTFYLSGSIADTLLTRNLMNLGFVGEICILAFALSLRFKNYKEQSEELLRRSTQQQEQIFKTVTDYQEKELQRLSSLLHDSVGARLSALRFNLESGKNETSYNGKIDLAINEINNLTNDVRQFSHSFSPVLLQKKGLQEAIRDFIDPINKTDQLYIQFEMIGSKERTSFRYELLIYNIIQELIQNIIKHSKATEAIVQLMLEGDIISIFVEDNGCGFDVPTTDGLGFSQIKQLVTFVNGTLRINSSELTGTKISIEFTAIPDEKKHPDTHS